VIGYLNDYVKISKNPEEIITAYSIIIGMFNNGSRKFRKHLKNCQKHQFLRNLEKIGKRLEKDFASMAQKFFKNKKCKV